LVGKEIRRAQKQWVSDNVILKSCCNGANPQKGQGVTGRGQICVSRVNKRTPRVIGSGENREE